MATAELTKNITCNRVDVDYPFFTELAFKGDTESEAFSAVYFDPFFPY